MDADAAESWNFQTEEVRAVRPFLHTLSVLEVVFPLRCVFYGTDGESSLRGFPVSRFFLVAIVATYCDRAFEQRVGLLYDSQFEVVLGDGYMSLSEQMARGECH